MSLSERLAGRERPSVVYPILVDDPTEAKKLLEVAAKGCNHAVARYEEGDKRLTAAKRKLTLAQKRFDACWERVTLKALPPKEYEALKTAHPPTEEQLADDEVFNRDTFRPALLSSCAPEMTKAEWEAFLENNMSDGERQEIFVAALGVNEQSRYAESVILPKGLSQILNSLSN